MPPSNFVRYIDRKLGTSVRTAPRLQILDCGYGESSDGDGIPWRTSRRLQEATYRLIQERDGGLLHKNLSAKQQVLNTNPLAAQSPQRKLCDVEPIPLEEQKEDHVAQVLPDVGRVSGTSRKPVQDDEKVPNVEGSSKIKGKRKAKTSSPPHQVKDGQVVIVTSRSKDENPLKQVSSKSRKVAACPLAVMDAPLTSGIKSMPQSSVDLLCSHVGLRGWKCYRNRVPGESVCSNHCDQS